MSSARPEWRCLARSHTCSPSVLPVCHVGAERVFQAGLVADSPTFCPSDLDCLGEHERRGDDEHRYLRCPYGGKAGDEQAHHHRPECHEHRDHDKHHPTAPEVSWPRHVMDGAVELSSYSPARSWSEPEV